MYNALHPNKIWSSKSAGITRKRAQRTAPINFFSLFTSFNLKPFNILNIFFSKEKPSRKAASKAYRPSTETEYKIFKPAAKEIAKETMKNALPVFSMDWIKPKKTFSFGFKGVKDIQKEVKAFSLKSVWYNINFYIVKIRLFERFNQIVVATLAIISLLFISYLSLFDTYFIVKNYTVTFEDSSYLNKKDVSNLVDKVKDSKFLGFLPSNQLWFLNSTNLTYVSKSINPEIESLAVEKRVWPNSAIINIKTEPILMTLGINNSEYWRIGRSGVVVTEDDAGIRDNLVVVDKPVYFNKSGISFQDISFANNSQQLNRFWYIDWLKSELVKNGVDIVKINIPSLFDTDVNITDGSGAELKFNSESIAKDVQSQKIRGFFEDPKLSKDYKENKFKYVDFRISKRIFTCPRGLECDK